MHNIKKRGKMSLEVIIMIVLLLFFLGWVVFFMIWPLYSIDFQSGVKGRLCQTTLNLARNTPIIKIFPVICSTDRIKFDKDLINKYKHSDENLKDAEIRFIYDKMLQCKNYVGGVTIAKAVNEINCYICYSLETKEDIVPINYGEFNQYALSKKTSSGVSYVKEFQKGNHLFILSLLDPESILVGEAKGEFTPGRDYGIVYIDRANVGKIQQSSAIVSAAFFGAKWGKLPGFIGGGVIGGTYSFISELSSGDNAIMLTDLEIIEKNCRGYLTNDDIVS